jgi:hypothetical protein
MQLFKSLFTHSKQGDFIEEKTYLQFSKTDSRRVKNKSGRFIQVEKKLLFCKTV